MYVVFYLFCQLKEASAALQKTSQQVQKLVQMVNKPSSGVSLLRPPGQFSSQSGEYTHARTHTHTQPHTHCRIIRCIWTVWKYFVFNSKCLCVLCLPCRYSECGASSVCIAGPISVHNPAEPKRDRGWASRRDDHHGKETHQDVAQRRPRRYQTWWCVTRSLTYFYYYQLCSCSYSPVLLCHWIFSSV